MIAGNSYLPVIWGPVRLGSRWINAYKCHVNSRDQLSPDARAAVIREDAKRLVSICPDASLWVTIDAPGKWYIDTLKYALHRDSLPIAITESSSEPTLLDFVVPPITSHCKPPQPTFPMMYYDENLLGHRETKILRITRVLSRMIVARTSEIVSVSGISRTYVLQLLDELVERGYVQPTMVGSYPGWEITKEGISWTQKYWNVPPGMHFAAKRREQRYSGQKHRYVSRMGRSWIAEAYDGLFEIKEYWTELYFEPAYPDALAWGTYRGAEMLVWLEVDAAKKSCLDIEKIYHYRWQIIKVLSEIYSTPVIFILLSQPWVLRAAQNGISKIPSNMAVVFGEWGRKNILPFPRFGEANSTYDA